jgi:chorismate mutase
MGYIGRVTKLPMIDDIRKQIDRVDIDLMNLLAKRMDLAAQIGREKKVAGEEVLQATRESVVLDKVKLLADTLGLSEDFVTSLYTVILTESRRIQAQAV